MSDPYALIVEAVTACIRQAFLDEQELMPSELESPIEEVFYLALVMAVRFGEVEYQAVLTATDDRHFAALMGDDRNRQCLIVQCQKQLENWRPDFVIQYYDYGWPARPERWARLIVECDGHDFHERTKQQAARDRRRDRMSQFEGTPVLRFTGSEIWRDPWACAMEVISWAQKGL